MVEQKAGEKSRQVLEKHGMGDVQYTMFGSVGNPTEVWEAKGVL